MYYYTSLSVSMFYEHDHNFAAMLYEFFLYKDMRATRGLQQPKKINVSNNSYVLLKP